MSIRNAGKMIREARLKSGLTLERLSENICSTQSLSRIEKGQSSISHGTFSALMEKTGYHSSILPEFEDMDDFNCFNHLNYANFHLHACKLQEAYKELEIIESLHWNNNTFYYQKWLLLHAQIQILTKQADDHVILSILEKALSLTCPDLDYSSFQDKLLSTNEIEILLCISLCFLHLDKTTYTLLICSQVQNYIMNSTFSLEEKDVLLAVHASVFCNYLLLQKEYSTALQLLDEYRIKMIFHRQNALLLLLTFYKGVCMYYLENKAEAKIIFLNAFYSAHAIRSNLASFFLQYIQDTLHDDLPIDSIMFDQITIRLPVISLQEEDNLNNGIFENNHMPLSFGELIRELRIQRKITQQQLCDGLCTKSKLSKIENGTLQPDVVLSETLLQRLGYSERDFIFYGTEKDELFHLLKHKSNNHYRFEINGQDNNIDQLKELSDSSNPLYRQFALFSQFKYIHSQEEGLRKLNDALSCTLPAYDDINFSNHLFSWAELSILNNIAFYKGFIDSPFSAITLFHKLLEYRKQHPLSITFDTQIFGITFNHYAHILSRNSFDEELLKFFIKENHDVVEYDLGILSRFYLYTSQATYIISSDPHKIKYTYYAYALKNIVGDTLQANDFRSAFENFSNVKLDY